MQTEIDSPITGTLGLTAAGETGLPTTSLGELPAPTPPRFNLFTAAEVVADNDPHWQAGKTLRAYPEPVIEPWTIETGGASKPDPGAFRYIVTKGFTVVGRWQCDSSGIVSPEEFAARARQAFLAWEVTAVEKQFWTNVLDLDPFLSLSLEASTDAVPDGDTLIRLNAGVAAAPLPALALLEDYIGNLPLGGVLHGTPALATILGFNYLRPEGQTLRTVLGTQAVVGVGYTGGLDAPPPAPMQQWVIATGPVQVRRSELIAFDQLPYTLDRDTNDWTVMYERNYLVSFDPLIHAAVLVDMSKGLGG